MKYYNLKRTKLVWSEDKIREERDKLREFLNKSGITDTDILNTLIKEEELVRERFISERGLTEEEANKELDRIKDWHETYIERSVWDVVLEDGVYGIFGLKTVRVEGGVVVWYDMWGFREDFGIATQEGLDKVLKEAADTYKKYEVLLYMV